MLLIYECKVTLFPVECKGNYGKSEGKIPIGMRIFPKTFCNIMQIV